MTRVAIITVTPEMALEWLAKYNTHNVPFQQKRAERHARAMRNGEWHLDTQAIGFAGYLNARGKNKPVLLNGQHRLAAVRDSGIAQEFIVLEGLSISDQLEMDNNTPRRFSQQLGLQGEVDIHNLAAVTKLAWQAQNNGLRSSLTPTYGELMGYFTKHAEDLRYSTKESYRPYAKLRGRRSAYGYVHYAITQLDDAEVRADRDFFFERLVTGDDLQPGDPIYVLREQQLSARKPAHRENTGTTLYQIAIISKTWNLFRDGAYVGAGTIRWRSGGRSPEPLPEPH